MVENHHDDTQMVEILDALKEGPLRLMSDMDQKLFEIRFQQHFDDVLRPLKGLYGQRDDFESCLFKCLDSAARAYEDRSEDLHLLDLRRVSQPDWFQQSETLGYVGYVDRFAGTLQGVAQKIPYLKELGITYLHLMPLLKTRNESNDGGFAVVDYRQVEPRLGTMDDLRQLAQELRQNDISLCLDFVLNHTAKEHDWARRALAGERQYQDYYLMYPDRSEPDKYEQTLREIFPEFSPGSFTHYPEIDRWVWTTFNEYQWDLNYANPAVFIEILQILLFLANQGVEIVRLDAVAFMWKRLGTDSENQPEAHFILQALRALLEIAAPAVLLKAEAIVPPPQLVPYLGQGEAANKECHLAYHNVFMVMLWSSLAEGKTALMTRALQKMPAIPTECAWISYVRCHDDIGWAVTEEDAADVGLNGYLHRSFLSDYYSGQFPGSSARGEAFQFNPQTGDRRISGSLASLTGLEAALEQGDPSAIDLSIKRILLLHNMILVFGGIPLIYMGDEIGLLNDHSYLKDPALAADNRWMHRPYMDWDKAEKRLDAKTIAGRIFQGTASLAAARKRTHMLHARARQIPVWTGSEHVFGLIRESARGRLLALANFSHRGQTIDSHRLDELGFAGDLFDQLTGQTLFSGRELHLEPYGAQWLQQK